MRVKTNLNAGFIILDEAVSTNALVKQHLTSDEAGDVLNIVLSRAEEIATDPKGTYQNVEFEAIFGRGFPPPDKLPPGLKRALVVLATYPLVARSFYEAAAEVQNQKSEQLSQSTTSADEGFERKFQEFKAATFILRVAEASNQIYPNFKAERMDDPNPRNIGKYVKTVLDQQLSKR